jgi:hypothetical protein
MAFKDVYQTNTDTNSKNCTQGTARACVIMNGHFARTAFATFRQPIDKRRRAAIAAGFLKGIIGALWRDSDAERHDANAEENAMERHEHEGDDDSGNNGNHVVPHCGLEGLHRVALHDGKEIDDGVSEERAEQHGASRVAIGEQMHAGPDEESNQHRVLERLPQMTAHVRHRKERKRYWHRVGRDRDCCRQRREQLSAAVRHRVTDNDQRQAAERHEREKALVASLTPSRHELAAKSRKRRQQMNAQKKDKTDDERSHENIESGKLELCFLRAEAVARAPATTA